MKRILLSTSVLFLLAACDSVDSAKQANEVNFTKALNAYLAKRGDLCLAKTVWPVNVTQQEAASGSTRDAVQMPVLEKLGLVSSTAATIEQHGEDSKTTSQGRRYTLTEEGKRYYLPRAPRKFPVAGKGDEAHDLCAARLSLDRVVGWEKSAKSAANSGEGAETVVTYTYKVDPAPWAADPDARRAFPMVDRIVRGAGTQQLQETMVLTVHGWEAKDL